MDSKVIKAHQCSLEKSYAVSIELTSDNWSFLDKNRPLGHLVTNILQKQNNEDFFIQLPNAWLHFNNNFPVLPTSVNKRNS